MHLGLHSPLVVLLTSVLLASAGPRRTDAAHWQYLSHVPKGEWFFDAVSIATSSEGYVQVWTKEVYNDEAKRRFMEDWQGKLSSISPPLSAVTEEHTLVEMDCLHQRFRPIAFEWYGQEGGKVIHALRLRPSEPPKWYAVIPSKPGVLLYKRVCP